MKVPTFLGKSVENIMLWIHDIENVFLVAGTLKHMKVPNIISLIKEPVKISYQYILARNENKISSWKHLKTEFIRKYNNYQDKMR